MYEWAWLETWDDDSNWLEALPWEKSIVCIVFFCLREKLYVFAMLLFMLNEKERWVLYVCKRWIVELVGLQAHLLGRVVRLDHLSLLWLSHTLNIFFMVHVPIHVPLWAFIYIYIYIYLKLQVCLNCVSEGIFCFLVKKYWRNCELFLCILMCFVF